MMTIDDILARLDKKEISIFEESVRCLIVKLERENKQLKIRNRALAKTLQHSTDMLKDAISHQPKEKQQ